ncbi:MAG: hypothetical protein LBP72_03890 [Dysgonamonadaceae bacterium]|jgi:hypothetical protein|nr:hypothetical protein [Dysgonamonadaceae bacterium]
MNITLQQSFSISETETGLKGLDNIYPSSHSIAIKNRLFIICNGDSDQSLKAGQIVCDAIQTYFHSFLDNKQDITPAFIEKSIRFGEISLDEYQREHSGMNNIATTLCLFYFASDCVYFSQTGSSYICQIRNNQVIYKSIDSSLHRKISGITRPVEVNIVRLKDVQAKDQFFIYAGELSAFPDDSLICGILSENTSREVKLSKIKEIYLNKTNRCFSAHLIPIRNTGHTSRLKQRLNSFLYFACSLFFPI